MQTTQKGLSKSGGFEPRAISLCGKGADPSTTVCEAETGTVVRLPWMNSCHTFFPSTQIFTQVQQISNCGTGILVGLGLADKL